MNQKHVAIKCCLCGKFMSYEGSFLLGSDSMDPEDSYYSHAYSYANYMNKKMKSIKRKG